MSVFHDYKIFVGGFVESYRETLLSTKFVLTSTVIGLIVSYCGYKLVHGRKLPPGPWQAFFLRTLWKDKNVMTTAKYYQEKFGDIYRVRLGIRNFIVLTDEKLIHTALSDRKLQGRTDFFTFKAVTFNQNIGLINSEGEPWHSNRRFCLKHLGQLGLGNNKMEMHIQSEAEALRLHLQKSSGDPIVLDNAINVAVLNILWKIVAGVRYEVDDAEIQDFLKLMNEMVSIFEGPIALVNMFPLLKWLPDCILNKLGKKTLLQSRNKLREFTDKEIERHEAAYAEDEDTEAKDKDLIYKYLYQIKEEKSLPGSVVAPDHLSLAVTIIDLFFAGSETTSSTLKWFILYMAQNPDIQKKIQEILDEHVPRPEFPKLEDRDNLKYLRAAIKETMRKSSLVPLGLPHVATEDTQLAGFDIPKGYIITPCFELCHNKCFPRPDEFHPENFLDKDGNVKVDPGFMPFSLGPRRCIGESLADAELFILTATLLQWFKITPGPNMEKYLKESKRVVHLLNLPPKIEVVMTLRPLTFVPM